MIAVCQCLRYFTLTSFLSKRYLGTLVKYGIKRIYLYLITVFRISSPIICKLIIDINNHYGKMNVNYTI